MKTKSYSTNLVKGVILAVVGILLIIFPVQVVKSITIVFGLAALLAGAVILYTYIMSRSRNEEVSIFLLFEGALDLIFGIILVLNPAISVKIFALLIGLWVIVEGIFRISDSLKMKNRGMENWGRSLFAGMLFLILGIVVIFHPELTTKALTIWVGVVVMVFGILELFIAVHLKKLSGQQ